MHNLPRDISKSVRGRLNQDAWWPDAHGTSHHVPTISQGYALNILLWLEERADVLQIDAILDSHLNGGNARDIVDQSPKQWLHETTLAQALVARLDSEHRRALVLGHCACQHCNKFIVDSDVVKHNGLPMHYHCASLARLKNEAQTRHSAKRELDTQILKGLADCHAALSEQVPGMMTYISDVEKLREIVLSLETAKTSDIMVLGVFLANAAESALAQFAGRT